MRVPHLLSLALAALAVSSTPAPASDDAQAEREMRRAEHERRYLEDQARRDMENRERIQADALRGQEEAIRRMEATQSRLEANSQRLAQQSADLASNGYNYPRYIVTPAAGLQADRDREDAVAAIHFAPLSQRLKEYFGPQSGVLVVSAGPAAPFGLQDGDVVISVDGRLPLDGPHAARILRSYQPGERVKLRVQRDRRVIDLDAAAPGPAGN